MKNTATKPISLSIEEIDRVGQELTKLIDWAVVHHQAFLLRLFLSAKNEINRLNTEARDAS